MTNAEQLPATMNAEMAPLRSEVVVALFRHFVARNNQTNTLSSYASEVTTSRGEQGIHVFTMYNFGVALIIRMPASDYMIVQPRLTRYTDHEMLKTLSFDVIVFCVHACISSYLIIRALC